MRYLIAGLLFAASINGVAQTIKTDTVVVQTITFEATDVTGKTKSAYAPKKNSVGMGIISWANGYVPFYYERYLLDFLSVKAGVGLTFRSFCNDLGQIIWNDGRGSNTFDQYTGIGQNVSESYYRYSYRKSGIGYYVVFAPKFYPRAVAMDGFCVYPMLEFKQYNFRANRAVTSVIVEYPTSTDDDNEYYAKIPREKNYSQKETERCLDFTINIGGHHQTSKVFFIEWRIGGGIRKNWANRLDLGYAASNLSNQYHYINASYTYSKIKPVMGFDLIMGGLF